MNKKTKRTVLGLLWIFSGFIVLFLSLLISMFLKAVLSDGDSTSSSVTLFSNLIAWTLGSAGVVLLFLGPFVGYKILTNKDPSD